MKRIFCFVLNLDDAHVENYSLKRLTTAGFAVGEKVEKEELYRRAEAGGTAINQYLEVREQCLISNISEDININTQMAKLARFLERLGGLYEQAAHAAFSLL